MPNKFQVKRTSVSGRVPNTTNSSNTHFIDAGELAINLTDRKMFSSNGTVSFEVGANLQNLSVSEVTTVKAISANGGNGSSGQVLTTNGTGTYWSSFNAALGAVNYAQNAAPQITTNATSATTLAEISLTVSGNPVQIISSGDANPLTTGGWGRLQLYRDSTPLGAQVHFESSNANENIPYALQFIDTPGTGTFVYSLKSNFVTGNTQYGETNGPVISVVELQNAKGDANTDRLYTWTNNHIHANETKLAFAPLAGGSNVYFVQQSDDNFVFYSSNTTNGSRAVWSIYANNNTSNLNLFVPLQFNSGIGIVANGSLGTSGQVLTSNGSSVYWSTGGSGFTNGQSISVNNFVITGALTANSGNGTSGQALLSNGTGVYWGSIGSGTSAPVDLNVTSDGFTGNGSNTQFTLSVNVSSENLTTVIVGGVYQLRNTYSVANNLLTFSEAPPNGSEIEVTSITGTTVAISVGSNTQVLFNDSGYINAASGFVFNKSTSTLTVSNLSVTGNSTLVGVIANGSLGTSGQVLTTNSTGVYWTTPATGTVTSVDSGNGLIGGTITSTGTLSVLANSGILSNTSGVFVNGGTGLVVNATGVHVNSSYIGTLDANNAQFLGGTAAASYAVLSSPLFTGTLSVGNSTVNTQINSTSVTTTSLIGNGASITSVNAATVGGNTALELRTYSDTKAGDAYTNATSYADSRAATAYSNAVSYADTKAGQAYTNATSYADTRAATAYTNAASYADSRAATAYTNAVSFSANADNITSGTLSAARLPATVVQNTDSRTLSGNLVISGTYFNPASNTTLLGNSSQRWILSANSGVFSGDVTIDGNLTVSGTTVTISANNLSVEDNMIYLNSNSTVTNPDLGFTGNYNDGTYRHAGFFRDATDGTWKVFDQYVPEPDASPYIDTSNNTFRIANLQANGFTVSVVQATTLVNSALFSVGTSFTANSTNVYTAGLFSGNGAGITSVNAATLGGNSASDLRSYTDTAYTNATSFAANATNISSGTLDTARLPATANVTTALNVGANVNLTTTNINVGNSTVNTFVNSSSVSVGTSFAVNSTAVVINAVPLYANGGVGTSGQVLTTNGTGVFWSTASGGGGFTNGQSISVNNFVIAGAFTANGSNGTNGFVLTSNGSATYWARVNEVAGPIAYGSRSYTGNGACTEFTVSNGVTANSILVMENGIVQDPGNDYTVSGSTLTFVGGAPANNVNIRIRELAVAPDILSPFLLMGA